MKFKLENFVNDVLELKKYYEKNIEEIVLEFSMDTRKEIPMNEVQRFKTRVASRFLFLNKLNEIIENNKL